MKRPKTSKIVVYTIVEDTIHGLLWVHNRFLCAGSCPCAYTLISFYSFREFYFSNFNTAESLSLPGRHISVCRKSNRYVCALIYRVIIYRNEKSFGQLFLSLNKYYDTIHSFWARFVYIHEIHDNELLSDIHFFMQGDRMNLCFSQYAAVILATIVHEQNWRSVNSMVFL